jgi:hypothetical protein
VVREKTMKKLICYLSLVVLILCANIPSILRNDEINNKNEQQAAVFSPQTTEKTTYSNVNSLEKISLKTSERNYPKNVQKITIVFQNDTDKEYHFGQAYALEKLKDGQWYQLSRFPSDLPRIWKDVAYILKPSSQRKDEVNLEWFYGNNYTSGRYRIVKDITYSRKPGDYDMFYLAVEFDILDK